MNRKLFLYAAAIGGLFLISATRDTFLIRNAPTVRDAATIIKLLVTANYLSTLATDYLLNSGITYPRRLPLLALAAGVAVAALGFRSTPVLIAGFVISSLSRALVLSPFVRQGHYFKAPLANILDAALVLGAVLGFHQIGFGVITALHLGNSLFTLWLYRGGAGPEAPGGSVRPDFALMGINTFLLLTITLASNLYYNRGNSYMEVYIGRGLGYLANVLVLASTPLAHRLHGVCPPAVVTGGFALTALAASLALFLPLPGPPLFAAALIAASCGIVCVRLHTFKSGPEGAGSTC